MSAEPFHFYIRLPSHVANDQEGLRARLIEVLGPWRLGPRMRGPYTGWSWHRERLGAGSKQLDIHAWGRGGFRPNYVVAVIELLPTNKDAILGGHFRATPRPAVLLQQGVIYAWHGMLLLFTAVLAYGAATRPTLKMLLAVPVVTAMWIFGSHFRRFSKPSTEEESEAQRERLIEALRSLGELEINKQLLQSVR